MHEIKIELRQRDQLSMLLLNLVLEKIISDSKENREQSLMYKSRQIISYADDVALIARNPNELKNIGKGLKVN